ncbi:MAG: argininosuccinate synthase [Polyangiaceae bacterium]|nr:argininosuccinate synthase [Polyangiaceae bacterium]MBK9000271.1 argininosuccinate synthase [Myxococcales bacterium]MCE7890399.1 argininosuccinate synthase [Sorangiineae bacterium PRO1]MCL4751444.1 argininosuccinate synthase [Myxococcales bacterium]
MKPIKKVVLAYSGGLDTSVILRWLIETYHCEVVAWCADVGQAEELSGLEKKAKETGAVSYVLSDLRETFVKDFVFPALRANAIYEGEYLLGTSLARPCIIEGMMRTVAETGADAIAHGATGKGNDQVRFELGAMYFDPEVRVVAPWREWSLKSRTDCIEYAKKYGIPITASAEKPYSMDRNLLHLSFEGGVLEDPWNEPKKDMFILTSDPMDAPNEPEYLEIGFEKGNPVSINGQAYGPAMLLGRMNEIAGRHGVGRIDICESRYVGMKSRGVYETPGGTVLHRAHRAMESITLDREQIRIRDSLIPEYSSLVYRGFWFAPERLMLQNMMDSIQDVVTGTVRLKLYKGNVTIVGRKSPTSLYREDFVTFERDEVYDQRDADGFIRLTGLRLRLAALRDRANKR